MAVLGGLKFASTFLFGNSTIYLQPISINMKTTAFLSGLMAVLFTFSACTNDAKIKENSSSKEDNKVVTEVQSGDWDGKLVTEYAGDIRYYNFNTKEETVVFKEAWQVSAGPAGTIVSLSEKFPKRNSLLQIADPEFNDARTLLDLSEGWFGGYIYGNKTSPDGKHIVVTITSYSGDYKIQKDGVYVFDRSANIVAQFENKYQADWTPDGRLVMTGSLLSESTDDKIKDGPEPGIFISDKNLSSLQRIDPGFNNPAPCNVAVSPDGERLAFIKNNHVWVMNIDGSNVQQLTAPGGDNAESFPTWSPDGKYIACWCYKTFEKSYYTSIAIVPSQSNSPIKLTNEAEVWPRDKEGNRVSGGSHQLIWLKR
jgi:Tol biopolymer transport system component